MKDSSQAEVEPTFSEPLENFMLAHKVEKSLKHLFPKNTSLEWYIRQHRQELNTQGIVIKIAGRVLIHKEKFLCFVYLNAHENSAN